MLNDPTPDVEWEPDAGFDESHYGQAFEVQEAEWTLVGANDGDRF
jgi:hypothetical protein